MLFFLLLTQLLMCIIIVFSILDPCATVRCANGYQCEVFQPTGEAFCQPNCSLNNGGCSANQTCRLQQVQCVRAPCPSVIECVDETTTTDCPPTCTMEFCSEKANRKKMCSKWVLQCKDSSLKLFGVRLTSYPGLPMFSTFHAKRPGYEAMWGCCCVL